MFRYCYLILFHCLVLQLAGQVPSREYQAVRVTENVPFVDGNLEDAAWQLSEWGTDFTQFEPVEGSQPSFKTAFKILYDDANIYVAIRNFDAEPEKIEERMTRRDGFDGDYCGIHIDSYFDRRTAFVFVVNAAGVKNDGIMTDDGDQYDESLDPVWFVKTKKTVEGWQAEMKIPLSQLRFGKGEELTWGLQVVRSIFRKNEFILWQPISRKEAGWVSKYGKLTGLRDIQAKKQLELAPFVVSKIHRYENEEGNPYKDGLDYNLDAGLDAKIALTNDLIMDLAINPDFGQVEADPSEVNLSAFESYFQEKRPFFIEGTNITHYQLTPGDSPYSSDNLFYSRRIGREPQYYPDINDGEYMDFPGHSRILGAIKLTGKTHNGWSMGFVESLVNKESARIFREGKEEKVVVEPLTNYLAGRLQKDINKGQTILGGMFTSTHRLTKDATLDFLPDEAYSGGIDALQFFRQKKYFVATKLVGSYLKGSKEAISEQQLASRRYFQRPDADYVEFDPDRTSLWGHGGNVMFGKSGIGGLRFLLNLSWRSPGLELNDQGYLRRADNVFHFLWAGYQFNNPFDGVREWQVNANEWFGWDYGGTVLFKGWNINTNIHLDNFWRFFGNFSHDLANVDNSELRGGPALHTPGGGNINLGFTSNSTNKLVCTLSYNHGWANKDHGSSHSLFAEIAYRPLNSLEIRLNPSFNISDNNFQYVGEWMFSEDDQTYLFARIHQRMVNLVFRLDYNITPDFTIQYYGAPFVASGLYDDYKDIVAPSAAAYEDRYISYLPGQVSHFSDPLNDSNYYGIDRDGDLIGDMYFDNPDFNFRQFRSNLVARWEYVPGSVLFLVWAQGRTDVVVDGSFDYGRDLKSLFSVTPDDVLLIKLSHRFRLHY